MPITHRLKATLLFIIIGLLFLSAGISVVYITNKNCENPKPNQNCDPNNSLHYKISGYLLIAISLFVFGTSGWIYFKIKN